MAGKLARWVFLAVVGLSGCHSPSPSVGGRVGPQSGIPPASAHHTPKSTAPATVDGRFNNTTQRRTGELPPPNFPVDDRKGSFGGPPAPQTPQASESRLPPGGLRMTEQPDRGFPQVNGPFNAPHHGLPAAQQIPQTVVPAGGFTTPGYPTQQPALPPVNVPSLPTTTIVPPPMPSTNLPSIPPPGPTPTGPNGLQTNVYPAR